MEWIEQLPAYLLVLARVLAFFTTMPLFSYRNVPPILKLDWYFLCFFYYYSALMPGDGGRQHVRAYSI